MTNERMMPAADATAVFIELKINFISTFCPREDIAGYINLILLFINGNIGIDGLGDSG